MPISQKNTVSFNEKQAEILLMNLQHHKEGIEEAISTEEQEIRKLGEKIAASRNHLASLHIELTELENLIKQVAPSETNKVYLRRGEIAMDYPSGIYRSTFTWEDKIDFILKYALKALKKEAIITLLKSFDKEIKKSDTEITDAISPILSTMCKRERNKVRRYRISGERGFYYIHSTHYITNNYEKMITKEMELVED